MDLHLTERVVIVTGSSSGIGKECARVFAEEGAIVCINGTNAAKLEEAKNDIIATSGNQNVFSYCFDVTNEEIVNKTFAEIAEKFGHIDILINNAGIGNKDGKLMDMTLTEWKRVFSVNVESQFLCSKAAVPFMKRDRQPVILNCGSVTTEWPSLGQGCYASSKAATKNFTKALCGELASKGIRVAGYIPGMTLSPIWVNNPARIPTAAKLIPLGRMAECREIATVVAFMASDQASYVAGTMFIIDGGKLAVQNPHRWDNEEA